jgi:AraC-like DNA-binding protein
MNRDALQFEQRRDAVPRPQFAQRHYSVSEIAAMWNLSDDSVRRLFEGEAGVIPLENEKSRKRRYVTLRIPEEVAERVYRRLRRI